LVLHARPKRVVVSVFDYRVKGGNNSCSSDYEIYNPNRISLASLRKSWKVREKNF